jgi:uncharacterized membrane protein YbhN (UPF0104 family)
VNFRIPKYLQTGIKLVLTAAALYYVLGNVDLQSIWLLVIKSNKVYLLFALVLFIFSKVVSSARLWFYLHKLDISITQRENLKLYWLGMYYNLFLPGGIGGDGYKTYWLRKRSGKTTAILISTLLLDRFSGLTMLVLLTVGLFYTLDILPELRFYPWIGVLLVLTTFFIVYWKVFPRFLSIFLSSHALSLLVQGLQLGAAYTLLLSLDVDTFLEGYLFIFLLSSVVMIFPLTIGGIGAREFTFILGANWIGLDPDMSIALSLLFYIITLIVSLYGMRYSLGSSHQIE